MNNLLTWIYISLLSIKLALLDKACPEYTFSNTDGICESVLYCEQLKHVEIHKEINTGFVKKLYRGVYNELDVVYSIPRYDMVKDDFLHGIKMLLAFQKSQYVVEMVGYCDDANNLTLVTKFYRHGSADQLNNLLDTLNLPAIEESHIRIQLALDYLSILDYLHNSPVGVRVMCDSNDLTKTLSQFLVTADFHLVVADIDALPEVNIEKNITVKCGHRQLFGHFVAPEQLWSFTGEFDDSRMKGYTEKVDIWKIPNILKHFLSKLTLGKQVLFRMFDIFLSCKDLEPRKRPASFVIRQKLVSILKLLDDRSEL